ncbi:restriction endonuclease subunit S [Streptococcus suis]|uniref:restriction endonuclease subunit S n=2 Tax=Streptococcus suis TaxID=1307 RepID=UPI002412A7F9|nr:restriction endonuclease subunit S [Streptococcus suis]MDG4510492.1 restriction endonuclease subunit S [Streptococcus suis]
MKTNNNIPAYRFQGYTDAWKQRKLGEVATFAKGNGYSKKDLVIKGSPIILYGRLYTKYETVISEVDTFVSVEDNNNSVVYSEGGEVLVPASGESSLDIARASVVAKKGIILGGDINIIRLHSEIFPVFLALTISNGKQQKGLSKRAQGKSVVHLHNSDLKKVDLDFPTLPEQEAIGSFFSDLDQLITLHQRKLDTLKEQKKTYLKLLFPAKGQTKPALRFQGFEDDWKEVKLGEVVSISSGYTGDATLNNGKYKLTRIETISEGKVDVSRTGFSNELPDEKYRLNFGDILFSNINSLVHIGKVAIFNTMEEVFHGINLLRLVPNKDLINPYFIYYQLVTESKKNWSKAHANQAVNQASINQTSLSTQKISISSLPEQEAIGTFFQTLDQELAQVEDKLASLKEMKKTLLRKLFV